MGGRQSIGFVELNADPGPLGRLLRLPVEPVSNALSGNRQWEAEGLGKTGEVYLLGPDQTMRTDSRFLIEDRTKWQRLSDQANLWAK